MAQVPQLGSCASSGHASPGRASPGRAWRLWAARHSQGERLGHWAPSHCLGCSSELPPKPPISRPLPVQEPRNISEFSYRYGDNARASILASFQAKGPDDGAGVMQALRDDGCTVMDLSGNELAKAHARHLVGGRSPNAADELLYRFEFPERRGGTLTRSGLAAARAATRRSRKPAHPLSPKAALWAREERPHRLGAGEAAEALSCPPCFSAPAGGATI